MHAYVRSSLLSALLLCAASTASAEYTGVSLPPPPYGPGGEDSIETAGGTRCRQSINSNGAYMDFGAAGVANKPIDRDPLNPVPYYSNDRDQTGLLYVRVTVPLGKRPDRIDCSTVYQLEIQRLKAEIEMLKMAAE